MRYVHRRLLLQRPRRVRTAMRHSTLTTHPRLQLVVKAHKILVSISEKDVRNSGCTRMSTRTVRFCLCLTESCIRFVRKEQRPFWRSGGEYACALKMTLRANTQHPSPRDRNPEPGNSEQLSRKSETFTESETQADEFSTGGRADSTRKMEREAKRINAECQE